MSTSTTTLEAQLREQQLEQERLLESGIAFHSNEDIEDALKAGANPNATVIDENGRESRLTLLLTAIWAQNEFAVKKLLKHGANPDTRDESGLHPLLIAAQMSNPNIIDAIITKLKINNTTLNFHTIYSRSTALTQAIIYISNFALIHTDLSKWSSNSNESSIIIKEKLKRWFEGNGTEDFSNTSALRVKYFGDIYTIDALLNNADLDPEKGDVLGITPLQIVQNPGAHLNEFITPLNPQPIIQCKDKVISFEMEIVTRDYPFEPAAVQAQKKLKVIVEYDFRRIAAKMEAHVKARKEQRGMVRRESFENLKVAVEARHVMFTPMLDTYQAKQERKTKIEAIKAVPALSEFYNQFTIGLNATLIGLQALYSGKLKREDYATLDKVSNVTAFVADLLPQGGAIVSVIATLIHTASDYKEQEKCKNIVFAIGLKPQTFCEDLALKIIEHHACLLTICTEETARKLAEKTIEKVIARMGDKAPLPAGQTLVEQLMPEINASDTANTFEQQCTTLQKTQHKKSTTKKIKEKLLSALH